MGVTSENVASRFNVSRLIQDEFAVNSHLKAAAARAAGKFKEEIVPITASASNDDGIRPEANLADFSKLPPVFKTDGTTTAGNASQVSDGAAVVLMMTRQEALRRCLNPLGTFRSYTVVGVDPAIMGVGPVAAIPAAVANAKLKLSDIDLFELNEAFASQATYSISKLGIDPTKVNVNGGAIALGHPLGATGARCVAALLHEMKRNSSTQRYGVVSMCIGTGMGAAAVFERN
jgi:acetyl-CoA acyltransferase 1